MKDKKNEEEKELLIALSAFGIGHFLLEDGTKIPFPCHLHLGFDFRSAFANKTIQQLHYGQGCDYEFLKIEMKKLGIVLEKRKESKRA